MILIFILALILIPFIGKLLKISFRIVKSLVINAVAGGILLFVVNLLLSNIGKEIPLNLFTAIFVGIFGVPAVIILGIYFLWLI